MSHDTHHPTDSRPAKIPFKASFWFVIVLVGLFIGAVNFVNVMGHSSEEHSATAHSESTEKTSQESGYATPSSEATTNAAATSSSDTSKHSSK